MKREHAQIYVMMELEKMPPRKLKPKPQVKRYPNKMNDETWDKYIELSLGKTESQISPRINPSERIINQQ